MATTAQNTTSFYVGQRVTIINSNLRTFGQIGSVRSIDDGFIAVSLPGDTIAMSCFAASDLKPTEQYAAPVAAETTAPTYVKDVRFDTESRNWDATVYVDGSPVYLGSFKWSWEAEAACDAYVYDALKTQPVVATQAEAIPVASFIDSLADVADDARQAVTDESWLNAITRAYDWLLQQDEVTFDAQQHELTVPSATTPGKSYRANGVCQCRAFEMSNACWHRAAARLVRRALERNAVAVEVA